MRSPRIGDHGTNDWCHLCGWRRNKLLDIRYSANAENDPEDWSRYIRICEQCVSKLQDECRAVPKRNYPKPIRYDAGFVYLFKATNGLYKIGFSEKPAQRLAALNCGPVDISLVHTIECDDMPAAEKYFHRMFASKRARGEWFLLDDYDVWKIRCHLYLPQSNLESGCSLDAVVMNEKDVEGAYYVDRWDAEREAAWGVLAEERLQV